MPLVRTEIPLIDLYNSPVSTCSQKVRMTLWEKEISWQDRVIVFQKNDHLSDWCPMDRWLPQWCRTLAPSERTRLPGLPAGGQRMGDPASPCRENQRSVTTELSWNGTGADRN